MKFLFAYSLSILAALTSSIYAHLPVLNPASSEFLWMDGLIDQDFHRLFSNTSFRYSISREDYIQSLKLHASSTHVVRFQVIDNQVRGPKNFCYNMITYLCSTYGLPDLDFLYWYHDGPIHDFPGSVPVMTGIRRKTAHNNLLFGNVWLFDIQNASANLRGDLARIDRASPLIPWEQRKNQAFWRGAASDLHYQEGRYSVESWHKYPRGGACYFSQRFPHLIDAAFTKLYIFGSEGREFGLEKLKQVVPVSSAVPLEKHLGYKYQLQLAGIIGNYPRDIWQFYSDSVSFRHPYLDEVYWSNLIAPWEHYIPVDSAMKELVGKIEWAIANDSACKEIAQRAKQFAKTHIMPEHMALYCYKVLLKYSQMQEFEPRNIPYPDPDRTILAE